MSDDETLYRNIYHLSFIYHLVLEQVIPIIYLRASLSIRQADGPVSHPTIYERGAPAVWYAPLDIQGLSVNLDHLVESATGAGACIVLWPLLKI